MAVGSGLFHQKATSTHSFGETCKHKPEDSTVSPLEDGQGFERREDGTARRSLHVRYGFAPRGLCQHFTK